MKAILESPLRVVGQRVPRRDAREKVTGAARYAADLKLPGLAHGRLLRSPHAHARIRRVDASAAAAMPGVLAVLTRENAPAALFTTSKWDATAPDAGIVRDQRLFDQKVRFAGEPVAAVAALDPETAEAALERIAVEYEPLPVVTDPEAAIRPDAVPLHEERGSNLAAHLAFHVGDIEAGFAAADFVVERRFRTSRQKQAQMEPFACVAQWDPHSGLTVWTPNQTPHPVRIKLARIFGLAISHVRVIVPHVGGGFGGRGGLVGEPWAAALAMASGRTVRLEYTRMEDFVGTEARHPMIIDVKVGAKRDGTLTAIQVRSHVNAGAYLTVSPNVTAVHGLIAMRLYKCPSRWFDGYVAYTNTPVSGAFRGFGAPQAWWALEQALDEVAHRAGLDGLELRRRLALKAGDIDPWTKLRIDSYGLDECIDRAAAAIGWRERRKRADGAWRHGYGMALLMWLSGTACLREDMPEASMATVRVNQDGSVDLASGATDLGTGIATTLGQIAAEELGVPLERVRVILGDTAVTPVDAGAHASRTLFHAGNAVRRAAADARAQILAVAASLLEANAADLEIVDGRVRVRGVPDRSLPLERVGLKAYKERAEIIGQGYAPEVNAPGFACHMCEVAVNVETGQVRVVRYVAAHDVGRAINPTIVEGQLEGALVQGLGYALCEDLKVDPETGSVLNPTLMDYTIMTAADVPSLQVILVETPDPAGPFGAKGVGEPALPPVAPAIANAIYDAVGVRITELPITPERVLAGLRGAHGRFAESH